MPANELSQAWEQNAEDWIAFARPPGHDAAFWDMNAPALRELLPEPGTATVDVGCGEGRVGRMLAELGHRVHGIDSSATLAAAARQAGGYDEVVHGDAAVLPWESNRFDLAVAFMCLMDMPDPAGAIREIARVLIPSGRLCIAVGHPLARNLEDVDYFADRAFDSRVVIDGLPVRFVGRDRPIETYTRALADVGFVIEHFREPRPSPEAVARTPWLAPAAKRPWTLLIRARRLVA